MFDTCSFYVCIRVMVILDSYGYTVFNYFLDNIHLLNSLIVFFCLSLNLFYRATWVKIRPSYLSTEKCPKLSNCSNNKIWALHHGLQNPKGSGACNCPTYLNALSLIFHHTSVKLASFLFLKFIKTFATSGPLPLPISA